MAILWLLLGLCGCAGDAEDDPGPPGPSFPSPWEELAPSDLRLSGGFTTELGSELPGAGWFETDERVARDASRARLVDVGGEWPVLHVELFGFAEPGWDRLELSVAYNHWVAGEVPLDGAAATGRLTTADGEVRYLVDGTLMVTAPGMLDGDVVSGWLDEVVLSEVAP
jgi:hypothetical protein